MSYREPAKPQPPKPRISGGPATVIAVVLALVTLSLVVMWLSATHGGG